MIFPRKHQYVSGASYGVVFFGLAIVTLFTGITCSAIAGDLLRGGYASSQSGSTTPGSFTTPAASQLRKNANDLLSRTSAAIQSVIAMQSAARKIAAQSGNTLGIPNPNNPSQNLPTVTEGLSTGGLYPTGGIASLPAGWTGVKSLAQAQSGNNTTVTVTQNSSDAILTWQSFNVGKNTTLDFNQSAGGADESKWIAFNIVQGSSIAPSQILGNINAGGQVYVINQNGIIFGGASQVNVHTLVASSLPIDTYLIGHGLLNNPDDQFLFSALAQTSGPNGSPAMSAASGVIGDVTVETGAQITSPANADNIGGRVALIGPNVTNNGEISTPDGQTILAAGLQVGFVASTNATLRGLDTYVGAVSDSANPSAGVATNSGSIDVPRGDAFMVGQTVDQLGIIASTTSVTLNGRIDLDAQYNSVSGPLTAKGTNITTVAPFLPKSSGAVVLGQDSVTEILPETASSDTVVLSGFTLNSQVNIQGETIHMEGDSTLLAPNATVNFNAGTWSFSGGNIPVSTFVNNGGQIYLDSGAIVNAAGSTDVQASVQQNILAIKLLAPELADSPSQRAGLLAGQTIYVDIRDTGVYNGLSWVGTPLIDDAAGFAALIDYTVGELTTNGGTVNMSAGGSVVMQPGSQVNVSGGYINYQGGIVTTSEVISGGHIYPISQALPTYIYQGFNLGTFTVFHPKYGVSETYTDPLLNLSHYENSYLDGGNGGTVVISSPSVALDGQFIGNTVAGPRQRSILSTPNSLTSSGLPVPSAFSLSFIEQTDSNTPTPYSPTPPSVIFSAQSDLPAAPSFSASVDASGNPLPLPAARIDEVILSPTLLSSDGFGNLSIIDKDGDVTVPAGVSLNTGPGGSLTISAANLNIQGAIVSPGGSLSFTVYDYDPYSTGGLQTTPLVNPLRGNFTLGGGASLNTAGLIVDDRPFSPGADTGPLVTDGGSVTIAGLNTNLSVGSVIDVSGGVEMTGAGRPAYGQGGKISISGGQDPAISSLLGGSLELNGQLLGFSGATGGALSILAPLIQVGGASSHPNTLLLSPGFFNQGGFASFTLTGLGAAIDNNFDFLPAVLIAPGTDIQPVITSLVVHANQSGNSIELIPLLLPVGQRSPVSLAFDAPGVQPFIAGGNIVTRGDIVLGSGATINTDPGASVTFNGQTVAILGSIYAPGGSISISGASNSGPIFAGDNIVAPTVDIGPGSVLSTAGVAVFTPNAYGYRTGYVLNGGPIAVSGNIVAENGSVLDVSGASQVLDVSPVQANVNANLPNGSFLGTVYVPAEVDSSGGKISLHGSQELFTAATLIGAAGGPAAIGGSLSLSSGVANLTGVSPLVPTLDVTQGGVVVPAHFYPPGADAIGHVVMDSAGKALTPMGYVGVDNFQSGDFASVSLLGTVQFSGPVSITTSDSLTVATGGVIFADSSVNLSSHYVALGLAFQPPTLASAVTPLFTSDNAPFYFSPQYGPGVLNVTASLIDIGTLSLQNIGQANFKANGGDIRGDGTLDVAGSIYMQAGQVYVPTEVNFTIAAYDKNISVASSAIGSTSVTLASATLPPGFRVGSPLLGSTVQSINGTSVTLASGANATVDSSTPEVFDPGSGSVTFVASGARDLPLSAGGVLSVYASTIKQDGVLRAPLGTINLGWDGSGSAPVDAITNQGVDVTQTLTLGSQSVTSVSAVDPLTGQALIIPYGSNPNGTNWIDPSGLDITAGGVPQKSITISAVNVNDQHGAVIDIRGGGDLMAVQFVPGIGGNTDVLDLTSDFAILPGYQQDYAPYDVVSGYSNSKLAPGTQIYLNASAGLPAGFYTLLPARYALLPGAFLVTPQTSLAPTGASQVLPDGGSLVSGYTVAPGQTAAPLTLSFEVDNNSVVQSLAQYTIYSGNHFLAQGAALNSQTIPRLPQDSGQLTFQAVSSLAIAGFVQSTPLSGGLGGLVNISSPVNIVITGASGQSGGQSGALVLNSSELNSFGAASLLIGGTRLSGADGTSVDVLTNDITVDSGASLEGQDIILAANTSLTVDPGALIASSGAASGAEDISVAGNGVLLRVSSDPNATVTRDVSSTVSPAELSIGLIGSTGAAVKITGGSVTLDSSGGTYLDPNTAINAKSVALNSGNISIVLSNPGAGAPVATSASGLILSGPVLQGLFASAQSLSLLSYDTIGIYGTGNLGATNKAGQPTLKNLTLSAGQINGFGGDVQFAAQNVLLENSANDSSNSTAPSTSGGTLTFDAGKINLGAYGLAINQFTTVNLNATSGVLASAQSTPPPGAPAGTAIPPSLSVQGNLTITTPLITGVAGAVETITANAYSAAPGGASGNLTIAAPAAKSNSSLTGAGLGATITLIGAGSVTDDSAISAHSGSITLQATSGNLSIGNLANASIDVSGQSKTFFDVTKYTSAGQVDLIAVQGQISVGSNAVLSVAAQSGGGNAGTLSISAPSGSVSLLGTLRGQGGAGGQNGIFSLDAGSIPSVTQAGTTYAQGSLDLIDAILDAGAFTQSISIRDRTDPNVFLDGSVTANSYTVSADDGSITIAGTINASDIASTGPTGNPISIGGAISLQAEGSVIIDPTAVLTVAANTFTVTNAATHTTTTYTASYSNAQRGGSVDLEAGSDVNGVASTAAWVDIQAGSTIDLTVSAPAAPGDLAGTLYIRAPQTAGNTSLQVDPIDATITGASSITVEGYQIYKTTSGSIDSQEAAVFANGNTFAGNTQTITDNLLSQNAALASQISGGATSLVILPGAEIINPTGNLTLAKTWDLSSDRFGPDNVPGDLTLRASGNIVFNFKASLTDGFDPTQSPDGLLWDSPLLSTFGETSWSYRIVAGADFSGANFQDVLPQSDIPSGSGSLLLGQGAPALPTSGNGKGTVNQTYFQTIRTGAGSIQIFAAGNVELLNNLATIYSAGAQAPALNNFIVPSTYFDSSGLDQFPPSNFYPAQYTEYGGNVTISAQGDIEHLAPNSQGQLVADSSLEMPFNWLDRQGSIDPDNGQMDAESTSWWIDFSHFYEGVATFGGGNLTLTAGGSISNVDAAVATNAAMPNGLPDAAALVELGGGNLTLSAGNNISGGVYYVERGLGNITAGGQITTNSTRAVVTQSQANSFATEKVTPNAATWLPTTLFAGKAIFNVSAGGDLDLGPVVNPFLLPQSLFNSFYNRSFFSTYAPTTELDVQSLTGDVEIKDASNVSASLVTWITDMDTQYDSAQSYAATTQPWLSTIQSSPDFFDTVVKIMPPIVRVTAFSGSIDLVGNLILTPAPDGTLDLVAADSINGIQPNGVASNMTALLWSSSLIDVSDADPSRIPGIATPVFGDFSDTGGADPFAGVDPLFAETGSTIGSADVIQAQQTLHAPGPLHAGDTTPLHLYAASGDISGLTLFSPKSSMILAGQDITDAAFYIQNIGASDISVVSAGRDIIAYDPTSPLRIQAQTAGNELLGVDAANSSTLDSASNVDNGFPTPGDIQISGPGSLEVLAGRNLTLGVGQENSNGTATGISSVGNARNPYLPFDSAQLIVAAGLGAVGDGLGSAASLDWTAFDTTVLSSGAGATYFADLAMTEDFNVPDYAAYEKLTKQQQAIVGLDLFYLVLRDSGRNHNLPGSPGYGNYTAGLAALSTLLRSNAVQGDINLTSKGIITQSGGDIDILDPVGQLTVGIELPNGQPADQGILTEDGGNISIYTQGSVEIGTSRIFTLRGGNILIWSTAGNIAAGNAARTVQSAPPTRVLVDPQSGDVETDLAGLATGGGIGVLATVVGVPPGNVDLIAPTGVIDAGSAGIRATGNLNLAAVQVLNASNIQAGGATAGVPVVTVAAPNFGALSAASAATGATASAASQQTNDQQQTQSSDSDQPSIIDVEVLGYGGSDSDQGG